ncbi:hypothetical protein [Methylosinus sp. PW1]|uniref:hypothetical protein n=1 Tax=Methylosinus sp. PW1 TaxID=107636 RepID=UPI000689F7E8|nr:hypothetical protein [Methylosinus sp. PW1]
MAVGDFDDMMLRLRSHLPKGWFPDVAPGLDAVLSMPATAFRYVWDQIVDAKAQSRISTATGVWLDLAAYDFLGTRVMRRKDQSDDSFRTRVKAEILRERVTKAGMKKMLTDLTGKTPTIFELWDANFSGGLDAGFYLDYSPLGETSLPYQCLMDVPRQPTTGEAWVGGLAAEYDSPVVMFPATLVDANSSPQLYEQYPAFGCLTGDSVISSWSHTISIDFSSGRTSHALKVVGESGESPLFHIVTSETISFRIVIARNVPIINFNTGNGIYIDKGTILADSGIITLPKTATLNDLIAALNAVAGAFCTVSTNNPTGPGAPDTNLKFDFTDWIAANAPGDGTITCAIGCSLEGILGTWFQRFIGVSYPRNYCDANGLVYDEAILGAELTSRWDGWIGLGDGWEIGGYTLGTIPDAAGSGLTDADIYDAIEHTRPTGTVAWTALE